VFDAGDALAEEAEAGGAPGADGVAQAGPSFMASLPSSSLQDDIDMMM
jgi:hypothetical protein